MKISNIPTYFQSTSELNQCSSFDSLRVGWPPSGYEDHEETVMPWQIPPTAIR